jgi:hypothetical protein
MDSPDMVAVSANKVNAAVEDLDAEDVVVGFQINHVDLNWVAECRIAPLPFERRKVLAFNAVENGLRDVGCCPFRHTQPAAATKIREPVDHPARIPDASDRAHVDGSPILVDEVVLQIITVESGFVELVLVLREERLSLSRLAHRLLLPWQAAALELLAASAGTGIVTTWFGRHGARLPLLDHWARRALMWRDYALADHGRAAVLVTCFESDEKMTVRSSCGEIVKPRLAERSELPAPLDR